MVPVVKKSNKELEKEFHARGLPLRGAVICQEPDILAQTLAQERKEPYVCGNTYFLLTGYLRTAHFRNYYGKEYYPQRKWD